jgi:hypothetical protein
MFNRFYTPDIDIDKLTLSSGKMFTTPEEQSETLRWMAIMSSDVNCDLAASTGIHTGDDMIKIIKSMANLDVEDRHLPKIGHIKFKHDGLPEFRLTVTICYSGGLGEKAILRIQNL